MPIATAKALEDGLPDAEDGDFAPQRRWRPSIVPKPSIPESWQERQEQHSRWQWSGIPGPSLYWYSSRDLERKFAELTAEWKAQTRFVSSAHTLFLNRSYQQIIGLGRQAIPLILRELEERPANWFWALECVAGVDPAPAGATFQERTAAWLEWGSMKGYAV